MNRLIVLLIILFTILSIGLPSCNDIDDSYSTNPNHLLSFSIDTLSFDTVFTTIGSTTGQFMIYNKASQPLNIESIRLTSDSKTGFRINVDGKSGESFNDVRILEKDSMYVFVEVTVDPTGKNEPFLIEDQIEFVTNQTKQNIILRAYGQDATIYKGGFVIEEDAVWSAERPYLIYDSIVIKEGVTLTIEKGNTIYMHNSAKWKVHGTLNAIGTMEEPITFRGDRLDNLLTELPYDRIPKQWDGIYFASTSFNNQMDHVIIRNGDYGLQFQQSVPDQLKLKINNSQITNMDSEVLNAVNCHIEAINTEFSNAKNEIVSLSGGEYHFIHCTLTNYFRFSSGRSGMPILGLRNYTSIDNNGTSETKPFPLKKATFENCLIDGTLSSGTEPLKGELTIDDQEEEELDFLFNHCAVKTKETDDARFNSVSFIVDSSDKPEYKSIGTSDNNYLFDYRLDMKDPSQNQMIIGKADRNVSEMYPVDRYGIDRFSSESGPDIGAYQHTIDPDEEE